MTKNEQNLFYTVGNRDLRVDGQIPPVENFRSTCEALIAGLKEHSEQLSRLEAPQLKNCLDHLVRVEDVRELDRIYLVVTDENPNPEYRHTDTAPAGELLIRWLEGLRSQKDYTRLLGKTAFKVLKIAKINPSDYAAVYRWFQQNLPRQLEPGIFWIHPVSGTPAMTMGLVLAAVGRWGEAVQVLYQTPHMPVEKSPISLNIFAEAVRGKLLDRLERLDLAGAAALVDPKAAWPIHWLPADKAEVVWRLVAAGLERSRFNFESANRLLEQATVEVTDGAIREELRKLRRDLQPLLGRPDSAAGTLPFLVELIFNARACWVVGREVDFLGRVYRLHEGLIRFLLESQGFPTDDSPGRREQTRRKFWERVEGLGLLEDLQTDPTIQVGGCINRPTMLAVLQSLVKKAPPGLNLGPAERLLPRLTGVLAELSGVRNRTILGHGFEPVKRDEIERLVRDRTGLEVEDWLKDLARELNPDASDPFEATVAVIRRLLGS
ncbi:MAG: hypothetical protein C4315_10725 [Chloroflexota bacterium]